MTWSHVTKVEKIKTRLCVDDVPCVDNGIGYLFPVVPTVVVVAVWLRARSLVCLWFGHLKGPCMSVYIEIHRRLVHTKTLV